VSRVGEQQAVLTLRVTDELDLATTPALRAAVSDALAERPQTLVLDLAACGFAGVDAVHALVDLTAAAREQGTTLLLVGMRPILRRAIAAVGLADALLPAPPPPRRVPEARS
jgi:anti-sigma B factor antagonist